MFFWADMIFHSSNFQCKIFLLRGGKSTKSWPDRRLVEHNGTCPKNHSHRRNAPKTLSLYAKKTLATLANL